jgi:single-strand selective monofunctional uracil DNA glycosylase
MLVLIFLMSSLIEITSHLSTRLARLSFSSPVSFVYDPTDYARYPLLEYFDKCGHPPKKAVFVGMNPGPWGMLQTGVPFGEVSIVRDWMGIAGTVGQPGRLHPKRPVEGFACRRSEVSGSRLWGWVRERFGTAENFFSQFLVINYCPLAFFDEGGKNITPDKLKSADRAELYALCDQALRDSVRSLTPVFAIGIGRFTFERSTEALSGMDVKIGRVTHPSPANPAANRGWEAIIERELSDIGIELPNPKEE